MLLAVWGNAIGQVQVRADLVYDYRFHPGFAFGVGMFLGAVGQAGDLIASLLKRDAGIKDSSSALPGFGGTLDVLDSPILVGPIAYWILTPSFG